MQINPKFDIIWAGPFLLILILGKMFYLCLLLRSQIYEELYLFFFLQYTLLGTEMIDMEWVIVSYCLCLWRGTVCVLKIPHLIYVTRFTLIRLVNVKYTNWLKERAILTPKNDTVASINDWLLDKVLLT